MYPHANGGGKAQRTMEPACANPCPCATEAWDGRRWCDCPGAPKDAYCRAAGCFAVYGGQSSTFENNRGFECGGSGGLVCFGAKWAAIHRELHGLFGGGGTAAARRGLWATRSMASTKPLGSAASKLPLTSHVAGHLTQSLAYRFSVQVLLQSLYHFRRVLYTS